MGSMNGRNRRFVAAAVIATLASHLSPAHAQANGTFLLTSSNTVSSTMPTTTVEIWAAWNDPLAEFMFGAGDYGLVAGEGQFSNPVNVLNGPSSSAGVITGGVIAGALNQQIHLPPFYPGSRENPILLATYTWTTTDFTPRTVDLHTNNTSIFIVFSFVTGRIVDLYPNDFAPGSGVITVVPAPAAWLAMVLPLVGMRRRR
jgi:hypothetical protein